MKVGVGIILVDEGKRGVWMSRRLNTATHPGCYQAPGGTVDGNEAFHVAAARELKEETGLVAERRLQEVFIGYEKDDLGNPYLSCQFAFAVPTGGTPQHTEPSKMTAWELVPWEELHKLPTFGAVQKICRLIRSWDDAPWLVRYKHQCGVGLDPLRRREKGQVHLRYWNGATYMGGTESAHRYDTKQLAWQRVTEMCRGVAGDNTKAWPYVADGGDWCGHETPLEAVSYPQAIYDEAVVQEDLGLVQPHLKGATV